jgi:hypothetical protein
MIAHDLAEYSLRNQLKQEGRRSNPSLEAYNHKTRESSGVLEWGATLSEFGVQVASVPSLWPLV